MGLPDAPYCERCHKPISAALPRCSHCGQRITVEPGTAIVTDTPAVPAPSRDGFKRYVLSPAQRQVLAAATANGQAAPVFVLAPRDGEEGEVKAGGERMFGNSALVAVIGLAAEGLLFESEEARFEATEDGKRVGHYLQNPLRRAAAEIWVPTPR